MMTFILVKMIPKIRKQLYPSSAMQVVSMMALIEINIIKLYSQGFQIRFQLGG
jgi:hypothetical protein